MAAACLMSVNIFGMTAWADTTTESIATVEAAPVVEAGPSTAGPVVAETTAAVTETAAATTAAQQTVAETTSAGPSSSVGNSATTTVIGPGAGLGSGNSQASSGDFLGQEVSGSVIQVTENYTYDQMSADLNTLKSKYGNHMTVSTYGTSLDGRNLYEVVVGNANAPKHVLIQASIHAREHMTSLLVMKQIEYALAFYDTGSTGGKTVADRFNQVAIHFLPMVNPDGVTLSQLGINGLKSLDLRNIVQSAYAQDTALGRTTASFENYLRTWKANARGVDLNQNFPYEWENGSGTATSASFSGYGGPSAVSEPESQALKTITESRTWSETISYHAMGGIIYWDIAANKVKAQSQELAQAVSAVTGYTCYASPGKAGYKDWTQAKDNPIPGITVEIGKTTCPLPVEQFPTIWAQNKSVWVVALDYAISH